MKTTKSDLVCKALEMNCLKYLIILIGIVARVEAKQDTTVNFTFPVYQISDDKLNMILKIALGQFDKCDAKNGYCLSLSIDVDNPIDVPFKEKDTTVLITYSPLFYYEDSGPTHIGVIFFENDTIFIRYSGIWSWFKSVNICTTFTVDVLPSEREEQENYRNHSYPENQLPSWVYKYQSCAFSIKNGRIIQKNDCLCIE